MPFECGAYLKYSTSCGAGDNALIFDKLDTPLASIFFRRPVLLAPQKMMPMTSRAGKQASLVFTILNVLVSKRGKYDGKE